MTAKKAARPDLSQSDRFKAAARDLGADESEAAFDATLRKIGGHKTAVGALKPDRASAKQKRKGKGE